MKKEKDLNLKKTDSGRNSILTIDTLISKDQKFSKLKPTN